MSGHAELGASACKRWWNCPGSIALSRGTPNRDSPYAIEGTRAHKLAEYCLRSNQPAESYTGRALPLTDDTEIITAEMAEVVQVYLDECVRFDPLPGRRRIEQRVTLESLQPPGPMFGTADFVAFVDGRRLRVVDLKYGMGVQVHAEDNPQLKYYALGALLAHPPEWGVVREIEAVIVQPRAPGGGVRATMLDPIELIEWSTTLLRKAEEALQDGAPLNPGTWCRFCPAAGRCPAQAAVVLEVAQVEFGIIQVGNRLVTAAELGGLLSRLGEVRQAITDIETAATLELRAGREVPGWKLVSSRPTADWSNDAAAETTLMVEHDFGEAEVYQPRKVISPAQARERLADRLLAARQAAHVEGKKPTKKQAVEDARTALAPLVKTSSSGSVLAPDGDLRPALPTAGTEFATLPALTTENT